MKLSLLSILIVFIIFSCTEEYERGNPSTPTDKQKIEEYKRGDENNLDTLKNQQQKPSKQVIKEAEAHFTAGGFDDKLYYDLLIETHLCNPNYTDTTSDGSTPCSSRFFSFYPYNHKRDIDDAFLLQVKAGVNKYPYRRLLIFIREKGKLVLMNGIVGYLVERITRPNEIDDLIVAVFDDLGNDKFDRYDVLIRYKDGKYHFVEALGDLEGTFETPELKERASKSIQERINEKELIF